MCSSSTWTGHFMFFWTTPPIHTWTLYILHDLSVPSRSGRATVRVCESMFSTRLFQDRSIFFTSHMNKVTVKCSSYIQCMQNTWTLYILHDLSVPSRSGRATVRVCESTCSVQDSFKTAAYFFTSHMNKVTVKCSSYIQCMQNIEYVP